MTTLAARNVTVRFGRGRRRMTAVDGVDLTVPDGTTVGLVGESGSGKSTLARAIVGMVPLEQGEILLDETPLRAGDRRRVQMVFQDPFASLNPRMTVGTAVAEAVSSAGGERRGRRAEARRYLDLVHLDAGVGAELPGRLSGGQRQRVAIARALAARPDVLIADEITSSLDVSVQSAVLNLIRELQRELGLSLLFVSHNLATVRYVSDVVAVMYLGRIVEIGPADEIASNPQHPYTQMLVASVPRLGEELQAPAAAADATEPPDPHDPPPGCPFHPRCPIGPVADPSRQICIDEDPREGAAARVHRAACHFAGSAATRRVA